MDLLSLVILIVFVLWLAGALGSPPAAAPQNLVWTVIVIVIVLWLIGGASGWHSGYWWHR